MTFQLDCSHYNGQINWPQVKSAGCVGAVVKTTDGATGKDAMWQANHAGARSVGIPVSPYHFSEDGNPAAEAANFASIWSAGWDYRPWLDEERSTASAGFVRAFRSTLRSLINYPLFGLYSSEGLLNGPLMPAAWIDPQSGIWAARYAPSLGWDNQQLLIWQFSSAATIPGVLGHVDESEFMHGWTPAADAGGTTPTPEDNMPILYGMPCVAGTNAHVDIPTKGATELYILGSYGQEVEVLDILCYGPTPNAPAPAEADLPPVYASEDHGGAAWVIQPNRSGPIPLPAGCVQVTLRYNSTGPFSVGVAS